MDNRLVLTVLFVTLSWMSVGTYAQSNTTVAPNNMTTGNMTHNMTTAAGANATMAPGANATMAPGANATMAPGANATMAPGGNTTTASGINATTASGANTTTTSGANTTTTSGANTTTTSGANTTTTSGANTTTASGANTTTASGANTTTASGANTTMASGANVTTTATAAPPLTPNTTVEFLETVISRAGCGRTNLCAAQPSDCDPSQGGSCFFLSARVQSGQNFDFGLSGESEGYIAATVSADSNVGNNDTTYVCAKNGTEVLFFGTYLNNGQLTKAVLNANSVKGRVNGNKIQCTFAATVSNAQTKATTVAIAISTGPFNTTSGTLGAPTLQLRSTGVDLGNPNATVTNNLSNTSTTAAPTVGTTNHAITFQQSLMQALLISVGMVGLGML